MHFTKFASALLALPLATAFQKGFNYGANNGDGSCAVYENFHSMFTRAQGLTNAPGFTSARLYTSVQCGSTNAKIEAIKAAIDTKTNLLLGVWASAGQASINNEIAALKDAASSYGSTLKARVVGISVGSEDLYRSSPQGVASNAGVGATSAEIVSYIKQVRTALKGTALEGVPIGHVDTFTAWIVSGNSPVIDACDFLGHNSFPYFETTHANSISQGKADFTSALSQTEGVAKGKPVWVTETGWAWKGPQSNQAVASVANAKTYWDQVGCGLLFGKRNAWWYTLFDANTAQTDVQFSVVYPTLSQGQRFNLQCPA